MDKSNEQREHGVCDQSYKINTIIPAIICLSSNMIISLIPYLRGLFIEKLVDSQNFQNIFDKPLENFQIISASLNNLFQIGCTIIFMSAKLGTKKMLLRKRLGPKQILGPKKIWTVGSEGVGEVRGVWGSGQLR